jgi:hypothetical protein
MTYLMFADREGIPRRGSYVATTSVSAVYDIIEWVLYYDYGLVEQPTSLQLSILRSLLGTETEFPLA